MTIKWTKKDIIDEVNKTLEEIKNPVIPMGGNPLSAINPSELIKQRLGKNIGGKPQAAPNEPQATPEASNPLAGKMIPQANKQAK
jgi:hypothetical protein